MTMPVQYNTKQISWLAAYGHVCILMPTGSKPLKTGKGYKEDVSKRHALRKKLTEAEKMLLIEKIIASVNAGITDRYDIYEHFQEEEAESCDQWLPRNKAGEILSFSTFCEYVLKAKKQMGFDAEKSMKRKILELHQAGKSEAEIFAAVKGNRKYVARIMCALGLRKKYPGARNDLHNKRTVHL